MPRYGNRNRATIAAKQEREQRAEVRAAALLDFGRAALRVMDLGVSPSGTLRFAEMTVQAHVRRTRTY